MFRVFAPMVDCLARPYLKFRTVVVIMRDYCWFATESILSRIFSLYPELNALLVRGWSDW